MGCWCLKVEDLATEPSCEAPKETLIREKAKDRIYVTMNNIENHDGI